MLAPDKLPTPILAKVTDAFAKTIGTPEVRGLLESQGADPGSGQPQEFASLIRREYERNAKVVKVSWIKVD
jgi:tripartite-type tricarboxylate transporter receptor subunit TctC